MPKSGFSIMKKLLTLVTPFTGIMLITISMGIVGFLSAIGITVIGSVGVLNILGLWPYGFLQGLSPIIATLLLLAVFRGVFRYLEQSSGHYIAFKLLAFIRDKVFKALRKLAPSKLDQKDSGHLISLITSDIELLEVFYAHTIAPIVIGILTSFIMLLIIGHYSLILAILALVAYLTIGLIIPYFTSKHSRVYGREYRENVGELNQYFLESLRGMKEIILFDDGDHRQSNILNKSITADQSIEKIKAHEGLTRGITEVAVLGFSALMLFVGIILYQNESITFTGFLISLVTLMSSYGPVVALSNLSNNLLQTLASGERVLALLEEEPITSDVLSGDRITETSISLSHVSFSYDEEEILKDLSLEIEKKQIIGLSGPSGCGKSTLLKLMMHFYPTVQGNIYFGDANINHIVTTNLRDHIAYVTQHTYLFDTTIEENLRVAKRNASMDEIITACKKANLYDFIISLPNGFQSKVGELGDSLSGGERQRLGIARAFLHDGPIILLDEPTSNLDSLNESIILQALKEHSQDKTIVLVSHRQSTMSIADKVYYFEKRRVS